MNNTDSNLNGQNGLDNNQTVEQTVENPMPNQNSSHSNNSSVLSERLNGLKKDKNNLVVIGVVAALILLIVLFVFKPFGGADKKALEALKDYYDIKKPIIVEEDGKYGYVTYNGKKMLDLQYDYAGEFDGKYAVVGLKDDEDDYSISKYQIIDKKGKVKIETRNSIPKFFPEENLWLIDSILYDSKFKVAFDKGTNYRSLGYGYFEYNDPIERKTGIINAKGKKLFSWDETDIDADIVVTSTDLEQKDVYAVVDNDDDKSVILRLKNGKVIYEVEDDDISIYSEGDNLYSVNNYDTDEETWLYIRNGKVIYEAKDIYSVDVYDPERGILELNYGYDVDRDERYKYYDAINKETLKEEPEYDDEEDTFDTLLEKEYGYRVYECDSGYGLIKKKDILLNCSYDYIDYLDINLYKYLKKYERKDYFILESNDKTIIYDGRKKKEVVTFDTDSVEFDDETTFASARIKENYSTKEYEIYNLITGKSKVFSKDADIDLYTNYIVVETEEGITYYNASFDKVYEIEFEKPEPVVPPVIEDDEEEVEDEDIVEDIIEDTTEDITDVEDVTTDTTVDTEVTE